MTILGIETSCDETAVSVVEIRNSKIQVLSNVISSQVKLHAKYGGVVPNLAAREHTKNIEKVFKLALKKAGLDRHGVSDIDLIAVTRGPGLAPSLLVGIAFARTLAWKYNKPLIGVNHLEGHIYSNWLTSSRNSKLKTLNPKQVQNSIRQLADKNKNIFPALNLIVSGGHTELVLMEDHGKYKIIGETLDDAAGEAFDKVARLLGLGYPGGPRVAAAAARHARTIADTTRTNADKLKNVCVGQRKVRVFSGCRFGDILRQSALSQRYSAGEFRFPRPMINSKNYNFSYAGLKTSVLYKVRDLKNAGVKLTDNIIDQICYEFQNAALDVLVVKTVRAAREYRVKSLFLSGGVSANTLLRSDLNKAAEKLGVKYSKPEMEYTGDNGAMIAIAGYFSSRNKKPQELTLDKVEMDANLNFGNS